MMRKLSTWLLVASAGGALVAGCGSSSTASSSSQSSPTAAASGPTAGTPIPIPSGATAAAGATPRPSALQSVASCKQSIQAQKSILPSAKAKLEAVCEKAASGDPSALHKAAQEACVEIVNAAHVPAGAYRERALAYCKVK
jgi:hypothetical protein